MQALRNAQILTRFMLVWFALTIGAAIASPLIKPQALELICSGSGIMKLKPATDDGSTPASAGMLDCPLCVSAGAPPPLARQTAEPRQPLAYALRPVAAAFIASRTAAPLPARGPPAFS